MTIRKGRIIILTTLILLFISICAIDTIAVNADSMSDKQIVNEYCHEHYKGYTIRYFTKWNEKKMTHRTNKRVVYVQIEKSISSGKKDSRNGKYWGYVKGQNYYKTWYNKRIAKGKIVKSYYIYNPKTNYTDDIVAVVDNKILR